MRGTLHEGFKLYRNLREPLARALFMMFEISEVHPFDDGNGRFDQLLVMFRRAYDALHEIQRAKRMVINSVGARMKNEEDLLFFTLFSC